MSDRNRNSTSRLGTVWLAFAATVTLLLAGYVTRYFFGGGDVYVHDPSGINRGYSSGAEARLFVPLAWLEARIRRDSVGVQCLKDPLPTDPYTDPFEFYYVAEP